MSAEKRNSFRCPAEPEATALLQWDRQRSPARLVDRSAEGFAVAVNGPIDLRVGCRLRLGCMSGWSEAEVVSIRQQEGETRIGLYRVRDLSETADVERSGLLSWMRGGKRLIGRGGLSWLLMTLLWGTTLYWLAIFLMSWLDNGASLPAWPW